MVSGRPAFRGEAKSCGGPDSTLTAIATPPPRTTAVLKNINLTFLSSTSQIKYKIFLKSYKIDTVHILLKSS